MTVPALPATANISDTTVKNLKGNLNRNLEYAELIPISELDKAIADLQASNVKASQEQATKLARFLMGAYPNHKSVADPEIYAKGIVSIFMGYPQAVGAKAAAQITLDSKFLPTRAEVNMQCAAYQSEIDGMLLVAQRMRREHDIRLAEEQRAQQVEADRKKFRELHHGKLPTDALWDEGVNVDQLTKRGK